MARSRPSLTEAQWQKIAPLLPKPRWHRNGGRPWIENRRVLEGILWSLRSGAPWQDLPEKYPLFCIPGGGHTRGDDAGVDPSRATASRGASAPEAGTGDYRQSVRQRSAAHSFAASRDRTDLSAQEESRSCGHARWPSAAPASKTLGDRTRDRLARKIPALGSTLRPFAEDLWRVLSMLPAS